MLDIVIWTLVSQLHMEVQGLQLKLGLGLVYTGIMVKLSFVMIRLLCCSDQGYHSLKPHSDWQVSVASFLQQQTCLCEQGFWCHFSGTKNWHQKLAGIEHVLFQASFCCETLLLIG